MIHIGSFIYSRQYVKALMMFVVGKLVRVVGRKDDIKMFELASHELFHVTGCKCCSHRPVVCNVFYVKLIANWFYVLLSTL